MSKPRRIFVWAFVIACCALMLMGCPGKTTKRQEADNKMMIAESKAAETYHRLKRAQMEADIRKLQPTKTAAKPCGCAR